MMDLGNRLILDDGTVLCTDSTLVEMLYSGLDIGSALAVPSDDIQLYSSADKLLDTGYGDINVADGSIYSDVSWFKHWMTPEPYASMDVIEHCMSRCNTDAERQRAAEELELFDQRNMMPVLCHLVFLVDHWRQRKMLWGVGRGSSVSSFILYLICINRINPLEFDLDIEEFLK